MALAELYLTDGTKIVNLLQGNYKGAGIGLNKLRLSRPARDTGGTFDRYYENVEEVYGLTIGGKNQDEAIASQRALDGILEQAANYFESDGETGLVWLVSRAQNETSTRYAVIFGGKLNDYPSPYDQPFTVAAGPVAYSDLDLAITRGPWLSTPPTAPACAIINNSVNWQDYTIAWVSRSSITGGVGLYTVASNGNLFAGYASAVGLSTNNGVSWTAPKSFTAGNVPQRFIVAFGKVYIAVARAAGANTDSGVWSCTLAGGSFTQEISSANYYSLAILPSGVLLAGGDTIIKSQSTSGGAWSTYSTAVKGPVKGLAVTPAGTLVAADQYDVWRLPLGGALALTNVESVGPFDYLLAFKNRLLLGGDNDISISDNDGKNFYTSSGLGSSGLYYSATYGKVYMSHGATVYSSLDDGSSWQDELANVSTPGQVTQSANGSIFVIDNVAIQELALATVPAGPISVDCDTSVYVANRATAPALAVVMMFDASPVTWTVYSNSNYAGAGSNVFPATVAVGDIAYFGAYRPLTTDPTFNALYFNVTTTNKTSVFVYEYWNGSAWVAIPQVVDGTQQLHRSGLLAFQPPSNWAATAVNSITAYYIRFRVTAIGAITATPVANNVYAPNQPYVELTAARTSGDIPALVQLVATNVSDGGNTPTNWTQTNALWVALRTVERGPLFTPYLYPVADVAGTATTDVSKSPRQYVYHAPIGNTNWQTAAQYSVKSSSFRDYYGTYRAFLRYSFYGTDNVVKLRLQVQNFTARFAAVNDVQTLHPVVSTSGIARLLDLGQITIGLNRMLSLAETGDQIYFNLQVSSSATTSNVEIFELILLPIDEWIGYFEDTTLAGPLTYGNNLSIDSATYPKRKLRALIKTHGSGLVGNVWRPTASGPVIAQPGKTQRYYFLGQMWNGEYMASPFTMVHQVKLFKHDRFLGLRGAG